MNKLLGATLGAVALLAVGHVPSDAAGPAPVNDVSAVFNGSGGWGNGVTTVPTTMSMGLNALLSGTVVAGGNAAPGTIVCTVTGTVTESVAAGSGTVQASCGGGIASLWCPSVAYARIGTEATFTGGCQAYAAGGSGTVTLHIATELVPTTTDVAGPSWGPGFAVSGVAEGA